jgi:hypothetical protein
MSVPCDSPLPARPFRCDLPRGHLGRHQATDERTGQVFYGGWNVPLCTERDAEGRLCQIGQGHPEEHLFLRQSPGLGSAGQLPPKEERHRRRDGEDDGKDRRLVSE